MFNRKESQPTSFQHLFPSYHETGKTRHSDTYKEFQRYLELKTQHDPSTARSELKKMLWLNLQALGEEMKGLHPHTAIPIKKHNDTLLFQRLEFPGGEDLRTYSLKSHTQYHNPKEQARFQQENLQMVEIMDRVAAPLQDINFGADPENIIDHITQLYAPHHFTKDKLLITPQIAVVFPNLLKKLGTYIDIYAGPQLLNVSPPSEVHNKGKTSFTWLNRSLYIPAINEFVLMREGLYTGYTQDEIQQFLALGTESVPDNLTEAELLQFIQTLPEEFRQKHSLAIFDMVIQQLGEKPVPPIDGATPTITINIDHLTEAMIQIFDWEIAQHALDPLAAATTRERILEMTEKILHHIGTDTPIDVVAFVTEYKHFYSQRDHALNPTAFAQEADQRYAKINPTFGRIKLDLSMLECGVGSITGGFNQLNAAGMNLSELGSKFGADAVNLVKKYEGSSLLDRSEFEKVCRIFGYDPADFTEIGICTNPNCPSRKKGLSQYLGPCGWCAFCQKKDDWGLDGILPDFDNEDSASANSSNSKLYKPIAGITEVINNDLYMAA